MWEKDYGGFKDFPNTSEGILLSKQQVYHKQKMSWFPLFFFCPLSAETISHLWD